MDEAGDIEQIRRLKARYFRLMDTKDWDGWRSLFTDDIIVKVDKAVSTFGTDGDPDLYSGADAFVAQVRAAIHESTTVHHGHMPEIEIESADRATGIWAMEDVIDRPDGGRFRGHGHYHEIYRKTGGEWRIAHLHLTRLRLEFTP